MNSNFSSSAGAAGLAAAPGQPPALSGPALLLMAVACGLCAGGNYFNQPLLHSIGQHFAVSDSAAGLSVTLAQVSYAVGLLLLVPLGDKLERRSVAVTLMLLAALGQALSGFAPNLPIFMLGTLLAGLFSVAAQILVPMASALAAPESKGRAVGLVMSGLLVGILAARSVAGLLSGLGGWNTVYRYAALVMVLVAFALWRVLPSSRNPQASTYTQILGSMWTLLRQQPRLRTRTLMGGLAFASVSVLFSTMALLLSGAEFGMNDTQIGLVGLAGVAGALMATAAGRLADKGYAQLTSGICMLLLALSWPVLWLGGTYLWWFLFGMLVIDLALSGVHITNQNVVYSLVPPARSRLNAVYMTGYFIGASMGSALGAIAWQSAGWAGTCALGLVLALLGLVAFLLDVRAARTAVVHAAI